LRESPDASRKKDSEIESLNGRIKQLVAATSGTTKSLKELQCECKALQEQKAQARDEFRKKEQRFASKKEALRARHRQDVDELEKRAGDLAQQLRDASGRAQELQEQNGTLRKAAEKNQGRRTKDSNDLKELRLKYASNSEAILKLEDEQRALERERDSAQSEAAGLQHRVDRMRTHIDEMVRHQDELARSEQDMLGRIEEGRASTGAEVTNPKSRATELENELSSLKFQHEIATGALGAAETRERIPIRPTHNVVRQRLNSGMNLQVPESNSRIPFWTETGSKTRYKPSGRVSPSPRGL
jgi:chromosome segregation ATPase